jgi:hypothetical protein
VNSITRLESFLEGMVERSFSRLFRTRLQPIEIAKRLTREMEAGRIVGVSSVMVPNRYRVALSSDEYAMFAPIRASLEHEMVQYLSDFAREHGYTTTAPPEVEIIEASSLRPGRIVVVGQLSEAIAQPEPQVQQAQTEAHILPPTEHLAQTQMMPPALVEFDPEYKVDAAIGDACLLLDDTSYPLTGNDVTLGRGLENAIVLEDRRISRSHARLIHSGSHWTIRDEGSTNGTFVNGRMVSQQSLKHGDCVSLGGLELVFYQQH